MKTMNHFGKSELLFCLSWEQWYIQMIISLKVKLLCISAKSLWQNDLVFFFLFSLRNDKWNTWWKMKKTIIKVEDKIKKWRAENESYRKTQWNNKD